MLGNGGSVLGNGNPVFCGGAEAVGRAPASLFAVTLFVVVGAGCCCDFVSEGSALGCSSTLPVSSVTTARLPAAGMDDDALDVIVVVCVDGFCCITASATTAATPSNTARAISGIALALFGGGGGSDCTTRTSCDGFGGETCV